MLSGGMTGQFFETALRRGAKVKVASCAEKLRSCIFVFPHILVPPNRPSSVFLRVSSSSVRGVPKLRLCLGSSLAMAELNDLMFAYLTDAGCWLQRKRDERLCDLAELESLLNPCTRLDA